MNIRKMNIGSLVLYGAFVAAIGSAPTAAGQPVASEDEVREIVRDYILSNPEVIAQALEILDERRRLEEAERARLAIRQNEDALLRDPMSPVSGNPDGAVTVVEFFDYRCGYCKRAAPMMEELLAGNEVRIVWKEFPILGPASLIAARAALAARRQNSYLPMHVALMQAEDLDEDAVMRIAQGLGLDMGAPGAGHERSGDRRAPARDAHTRPKPRYSRDSCFRRRRGAGSRRDIPGRHAGDHPGLVTVSPTTGVFLRLLLRRHRGSAGHGRPMNRSVHAATRKVGSAPAPGVGGRSPGAALRLRRPVSGSRAWSCG